MRAIALVSGGLDSVVATWAARAEYDIAAVLTCDYGQRAARREIAAAGKVAERLGCPHIVVALPWLGAVGGSALTDVDADIPAIASESLDDMEVATETAAAVWVPNRNGVLTNVAATYAEVLEADAIVVGFNREEGATFPDNTPEFMAAADAFFSFSTRHGVQLISPTAPLSKPEIVILAIELGAPLDLVWSCYRGGEQHCWECESCRRLRRALDAAGAWDSFGRPRPA